MTKLIGLRRLYVPFPNFRPFILCPFKNSWHAFKNLRRTLRYFTFIVFGDIFAKEFPFVILGKHKDDFGEIFAKEFPFVMLGEFLCESYCL